MIVNAEVGRRLLLHVARATDSGQSAPFRDTPSTGREDTTRRSGQSSDENITPETAKVKESDKEPLNIKDGETVSEGDAVF
ncbi:MAG: hypothetical protein DHS20C01_34530 [marine bacterium B5-7]|nr:MAG: hypothetical protein DHS20C01_34530 [marine bacterium B5-7]